MIEKALKPLQVVSASAGSGKTYNLVYQYILLLFNSPQKDAFSKIVAMTFTNKAALEMKTRVIGALEVLAFPENFAPSDRKYEAPLQAELKLSKEVIHARAKVILKSILHRYEDFMLLTIDKFNLKLLRSFSRDLDIAGDFEVVIDAKLLLQKVLDQILSEIGTKDHDTLTKLALSFAESQVSEDNSWNIQSSIKNVIYGLIKEKNVDLVQLLREKEYGFLRYAQLKNEIEQLKKPILEIAKELDEYLKNQSKDDFTQRISGKSVSWNGLKNAVKKPFLLRGAFSSAVINHVNTGNKTIQPIPELCSLV
ncbi:MAG: UvrD-helicase domain-containing protein, partial [Bacteroidetes bacterium]|nr:UvrD-helicase domain-containing protein [Bacteroidota bacterium]